MDNYIYPLSPCNPTDLPSGGGGSEWRLIKKIENAEDNLYSITVNKDEDGNAFELEEFYIYIKYPIAGSEATANIAIILKTNVFNMSDAFDTRNSGGTNAANGVIIFGSRTLRGSAIGNGAGNRKMQPMVYVSDAVIDKTKKFSSFTFAPSATSATNVFGVGFTAYVYGR